MIQAKAIQQNIPDNGMYELFEEQVVKDVKGNDVTIPKSIGTFSLQQLNADKQRYLDMITSIEEKITAINNLKNS